MRIESLVELKAAFEDWRSGKRHAREVIPDELLDRARRTIRVHGLGPVARATRVGRARLIAGRAGRGSRRRGPAARVPSFSRLEIGAPSAPHSPMAEVETPSGVKLRIFTQTEETFRLLSSLCGLGGAR
jgi:hypothetical protein